MRRKEFAEQVVQGQPHDDGLFFVTGDEPTAADAAADDHKASARPPSPISTPRHCVGVGFALPWTDVRAIITLRRSASRLRADFSKL